MAGDRVVFEVKATATGFEIVQGKQKKLAQSVQGTSKAMDDGTKKSKDFDKQNKSLYQSNLAGSKSFSKMNQTIGSGSSGLVGAYATLAANVFAATAAFNALRRASQVEQLISGLEALGNASGKNLTLLADRIKEAAGEAIALDDALRVASVGASASFSGAQLEGLAEVARSAAIALGRDVGDAIDRLARGAAKLEPEILDELGIFVRLDDASAKYAASVGKATSELTRFEQRQAFANEIIDQGRRKFSEVGAAVDVSPFDKLAASLADLARGFTDIFNKLLGPLANFLSENTLALAGLIAVLTKGIVSQALPILGQFANKAKVAAANALGLVSVQQRAINEQVNSLARSLPGIKGIGGAFATNNKIIKSGKFTVEELKASTVALNTYVLNSEAKIAAGKIKNVQLVQKRIDQAKIRIAQEEKLLNLALQRQGQEGDVPRATSVGKFEARGASILNRLDKPGKGGVKGYLEAFKLSSRANKRFINEQKAAGLATDVFGVKLGFLGKGLNRAGLSLQAFGLTGRIAIKGLFTAIPVIGQLLLVIDLLIVGVKKAIGFFAGYARESSALEKANERLGKQTKFFAENQTAAAEATRSAKEQVISSGNAIEELIKATQEQSEQQQKANEEIGIFGTLLNIARRELSFLGMKFATVFNGLDGIFKRLALSFEDFILEAQNRAAPLFNAIITFINYLNRDTGIEPIALIDENTNAERIAEIAAELEGMEKARKKIATADTLNIFGSVASTSAEFESFQTVLRGTGEASRELSEFLGTDDINQFAESIANATRDADGNIVGLNGSLAELVKEIGILDDGVITSVEYQELLGAALKEGTKQSVANKTATSGLGEAFQNSNEKIAEFFNTFTKKTGFSTFQSIIKEINGNIKEVEGTLSSSAIIDILEGKEGAGLSGAFKDFVENGEGVKQILKEVEGEFEILQSYGVELTEELKAQVREEYKLGEAYKKSLADAEKLVNAIVEAQLYDKARLDILKAQEASVNKYNKANEASVGLSIDLANRQSQINQDRLSNEIKFQEQRLGLAEGARFTEEQIANLDAEKQGQYAKLLEQRNELRKEQVAEIGAEERLAMMGLAKNDLLKEQLGLTREINSTLATTVKNEAILSNIKAGRGGKLSDAQKLEAEIKAAADKVKFLKDELALMQSRAEFEIKIAEIRLTAEGIVGDAQTTLISGLKEQLGIQQNITKEKIKQAESDQTTVGASRFEGLQGGIFADVGDAFDTAKIESETNAGKTVQGRLELMTDALAPMREQLEALGPEGELISVAQQGLFTLASSFDVIKDKGLASAEGMAAVGNAILAIGAIQQAAAKAQVANIDQQIEAEKKRDGKSAESVAKIRAMEKKKEMIQRKAFEQKKKMDIASAIISTALGVTRALELGPIIGPILAGLQLAMGLAQIAIIKRQQFQGGGGDEPQAVNTALSIGGRSNAVDVSQGATSGELNYLRGGRTTGQNLGGAGASFPGAAMGRRGYNMGTNSVVVGENGPEVATFPGGTSITPNYALGKGETNVNFTINAVDGQSVQNMLYTQRGNIIGMIREAANANGEGFLESVDPTVYGGNG